MAINFSGGGRRSTRRELPAMHKQLANLTTCSCKSSAPFVVIYKAGRKPTQYWWKACMSWLVIKLPSSLSHPGSCLWKRVTCEAHMTAYYITILHVVYVKKTISWKRIAYMYLWMHEVMGAFKSDITQQIINI